MGRGEHETRFLKEEEKEGSRFHERKDENDSIGIGDAHKRERKRKRKWALFTKAQPKPKPHVTTLISHNNIKHHPLNLYFQQHKITLIILSI